MTWDRHIQEICRKAAQRLHYLSVLRRAGVQPKHLITVYCMYIRSVLEYACQVWHSHLTTELSSNLERIQKRAMSIMFPNTSYDEALAEAKLPTLCERRRTLCRTFNISKPDHMLNSLLPAKNVTPYATRQARKYITPRARTNRFNNSFIPWCVRTF